MNVVLHDFHVTTKMMFKYKTRPFVVQGFSKFSGRLCIISGNGRANIFQIAKGGGRVSKLVEEVLQR